MTILNTDLSTKDHKSLPLALKKSAKTSTQLSSVGSDGNSSLVCFEASGKGRICYLNLEVQMKIQLVGRYQGKGQRPPLIHRGHPLVRQTFAVLRYPQCGGQDHIAYSKSQWESRRIHSPSRPAEAYKTESESERFARPILLLFRCPALDLGQEE